MRPMNRQRWIVRDLDLSAQCQGTSPMIWKSISPTSPTARSGTEGGAFKDGAFKTDLWPQLFST